MAVCSNVLSVKLIRNKHHVSFMAGEKPDAIIAVLRLVPTDAVVDDVDTTDSGVTTVVFHSESVSESH